MDFLKITTFFALFLFLSCSKKSEYVLSQNKMVNVLTDLHIADAAGTQLRHLDLDSAGIYNWVFEKNKISSAEFDSSMAYYSRHGDKLIQIYNKVLTNLSKEEADIKEKQVKETDEKISTVWENTNVYRLPFDGSVNKVPFDVPIKKTGTYTISVKLKILNRDQSISPHLTAHFWSDDGSNEGQVIPFKEVTYKKSNKTSTYSTTLTLNDKQYTHIKGFVLDHNNPDSNFIKQAEVYSIKVTLEEE